MSSPISSVPSNSRNAPRTVEMPRCLTRNSTLEWAASTDQVPVGTHSSQVAIPRYGRSYAMHGLLESGLARAGSALTSSRPLGPHLQSCPPGDWCIGLTRRSPKPQREVRLLGPPLSSTSGGSSTYVRGCEAMRTKRPFATCSRAATRTASWPTSAACRPTPSAAGGARGRPSLSAGGRLTSSRTLMLGMYLGDGCLYAGRGRVRLQVSLDSSYPAVIDDCWTAMVLCMPDRRAALVQRSGERVTVVQSCSKLWLIAFPQHGRGQERCAPG